MSDTLEPFESAILKVARASRHIQELEHGIGEYLASKPVVLIVEQPEDLIDLDCHVWVARVKRTVPKEFAVVIGDVVHNLRAALDLLATDLVRLNGQDGSSVYFPFAQTDANLERQIKEKNFRRAHPDVVALLRSLKPYTGGNVALRGLHDLDIQDKHQALIPTFSAAKTEEFTMLFNGAVNTIPEWASSIPRDGYWMVMMPALDNVPLGSEIAASYALIFHDDTPFAGSEIVPTLRGLCDYVTSVVKAFQSLYVGQSFPAKPTGPKSPHSRALVISPTTDPNHLNKFTRIK